MRKEKEVITQILEYVDASGKKDFVQEVTEHFTTQRHGEEIRSEERSYRRISDRAELKCVSDCEFKVVGTGQTILIVDRSLGG